MIAKLAAVAQKSKTTKETPLLRLKSLFMSFSLSTSSSSFPSRVFACPGKIMSSQLPAKPETFPSPLPQFINLAGTRVQGSGQKNRCINSQPCPALRNQAWRYELQAEGYSLLPAGSSKHTSPRHSPVITKVSCSSARCNSFNNNTLLPKS